MQQTIIHALDFDGVICDNAVETGITGWKAAAQLWPDMPAAFPPEDLIDQFRLARPIIETGFEAILVMRMLFEDVSLASILEDFPERKRAALLHCKHDEAFLKQLFGETRDHWIRDALPEWVAMNPLFPGIAERLAVLGEQDTWYIVTTKQERFVSQILEANRIALPAERIFGLDRNMSKEQVLLQLQEEHPEAVLHFVEDRLPTLGNFIVNDALQAIKLFFADWGYNTARDKRRAAQLPLEVIGLDDFLNA